MAAVTADVKAPGGIEGTGPVLVVEHTTDNNLVTFRFKHADVKMEAAEEEFEAGGRKFRAGSFIIRTANRAALEPTLTSLGLSAWAVAAAPTVRTHDLDVPRIGYVHSWANTQNEGWVRAAFDTYGVPYTYFARHQAARRQPAPEVRRHRLSARRRQRAVAGQRHCRRPAERRCPTRRPRRRRTSARIDQADDIRGGMGWEGLMELVKFVREGGTLITEGSTSTIFPEYNITSGVTVENPEGLFVRGSVMRGVVRRPPQPDRVRLRRAGAGLLQSGPGAERRRRRRVRRRAAARRDSRRRHERHADGDRRTTGCRRTIPTTPPTASRSCGRRPAAGGQRGRSGWRAAVAAAAGGGRGGGSAAAHASEAPRVVLAFPSNPDEMLLSGVLVGGQALANRAQVVDIPVGQGHVVSFAIRPFWRWQTQGTFFLGFNTILNWNDLDAGKALRGRRRRSRTRRDSE